MHKQGTLPNGPGSESGSLEARSPHADASEYSSRFEWDPDKNASNKLKHGIDFVTAQAIWDDPCRAVLDSTLSDEPRQLTIGLVHGRMYTAITTTRGDIIRIISVRRSRKEEEVHHAGQNDN